MVLVFGVLVAGGGALSAGAVFLFEVFVGCLAAEAAVQLVELFGVDAVRPLDLAVQPWGAGFDVDVADALVQDGEVERGMESLSSTHHTRAGGDARPRSSDRSPFLLNTRRRLPIPVE